MEPLFILWEIDPRIFPAVEFLRWYGLLWAIGIFFGYRVMAYIYKMDGNTQQALDKLVFLITLGIIIGARIGHILFYDPIYYFQNPVEILPVRFDPDFQFTGLAGLASHGGVIGGLIALYLYQRKHRENYLRILDRLAIAGVLLGGFIRLGNFMNSEIIGVPASVPWAVIFTGIDNIPRHPAQLYEAAFYFLIFIILFFLWKATLAKKESKLKDGYLFSLCLILVFTQRFIVEFFKADQVLFEKSLPINMGQILSIPFVITGIVLLLRNYKKPLLKRK